MSFSTASRGQLKSIAQWGVDTAWPSPDNMRQALAHMGVDQIDVVRLNFYIDEPLQADGTLGPNARARIDNQLAIAAMAGDKPLALTPNSGDATDGWYLNGNQVRVDRWVQVIKATQQYLVDRNKTLVEVEPFNEPDFWPGQGTPQNLYDVMIALDADPAFQNVAMVGPSTRNSDQFAGWYNTVGGPADYGSTHQLAGSTDSYVNFIQTVKANGDVPYNPEIHSMAEALYGAEYGLEGAIWWGPAALTRGVLVDAIQGKRLGYAENRSKGIAAALYRAPDGQLRAFAGGFERDYQGTPGSMQFEVTDRDVYFNGIGPIHNFSLYATQTDQGSYADVTFTPDATPALDGHRWKIVNRATGESLEVASGGLTDGTNVDAASDVGGLNQRWDVVRTLDGYYTLTAAHSGKTVEVADWSLSNGGNIRQWGSGDNFLQHWFLEEADPGYFYLRNAHSVKYMTQGRGNVDQRDLIAGAYGQQWQFVRASPDPRTTLSAHFKFDGSGSNALGGTAATVSGSPSYVSGKSGQAIQFDGVNDFVELPVGVADTQDLTVAAWVYWDGGDAWQRIFDFGDDVNSYLFLTPRSGDDTLRFAITDAGNGVEQIIETEMPPINQWVHVAVTLGGNTGVLYVDGEPRAAGQITLNPSDISPAHNYVGKSQWPDPLFSGAIDDFRIFDVALDQWQIADLFLGADADFDGDVDGD
ncbi:MAG: RICIN domain-containing protein, partial [Planctomycetales bacterium]|nr:RICIN domain-containing protein [Planctomycetales bacterium]